MKLWMWVVMTKTDVKDKRWNYISGIELVQAANESDARNAAVAAAIEKGLVSSLHFRDGLAEVAVRPF